MPRPRLHFSSSCPAMEGQVRDLLASWLPFMSPSLKLVHTGSSSHCPAFIISSSYVFSYVSESTFSLGLNRSLFIPASPPSLHLHCWAPPSTHHPLSHFLSHLSMSLTRLWGFLGLNPSMAIPFTA